MNDSVNLKRVGLKATAARLRILEVLNRSTERHLTADDIFRRLVHDHADIGLATVYRALAQLEAAGILTRTTFETGRAVFEVDHGQHHDHMVCVRCGSVDDFHDTTIEERQAQLANERGFALQEHRHSLFGVCSACRRAAAEHAEAT